MTGVFVWRTLWWFLRTGFSVARSRRSGMRGRRPFPVRVIRVQDGDSLLVRPSNRNDGELRVRLYGIDAPEHDQDFGREATVRLRAIVRGRTDLLVEPVDTDRYGRLVGVLYSRASGRGNSVNRALVQEGLARWYSRYGGRDLGLEQAEREARRGRRGVWSARRQVAPWDHRRAQREAKSRGGLFRTLLVATVVSVVVLLAIYLLPQLV